jgi:hypothetical protein
MVWDATAHFVVFERQKEDTRGVAPKSIGRTSRRLADAAGNISVAYLSGISRERCGHTCAWSGRGVWV